MKQSDDPKAFLKKYGFTSHMSKPHPGFDDEDMMEFEGLEADYVMGLECKLEHLETYIKTLQMRMDWLIDKDHMKFMHEHREPTKEKL